MVPYFLSFDLPKQIVNGPIQGQGFESAGRHPDLHEHQFRPALARHDRSCSTGFELDRACRR